MIGATRAAIALVVIATASPARGADGGEEPSLGPSACRWCEGNGFDEGFRARLVWSEPRTARQLSDGALIAVPVLAAAALVVAADERGRRTVEDLSLVGASVLATALGTQFTKLVAARERPYAHHGRELYGERADVNHSFWSGHTALTMAGATSAAFVAERRGYPAWPWMLAVGSSASLVTGYLRVAADKHWATDVLAGAAFGTLVGWATPALLLRQGPDTPRVVATPIGIAGVF